MGIKLNTPQTEGEKRLLIIDDEENMRHMLSSMLKKSGYRVDTASDGLEGVSRIQEERFDFILCDLRMPKMGGMAFLEAIQDRLSHVTVIMMSAYGSVDNALEAMKKGAYDYISKPFKTDEVYLTLRKAEERERLRKENHFLKEQILKIESSYRFGRMVAKSAKMQAVFQLAEKAQDVTTTVLIYGESGTGKELVARGIHFQGERAKMPFVTINCAGIPETLLESELFGHRKGSFTGAIRDNKGLFEEAEQGTIFLDEIGEMPFSLQAKLLRVLQEKEIRAVGDAKTKAIDVRVIAATSKKLEEEISKGLFREDLFYRLNVLPIRIPPLRERLEDIPLLCRHFMDKFSTSFKKPVMGISSAGMSVLLKHHWPGNVRELENLIERAVVLAEGDLLEPEHLSVDTDIRDPDLAYAGNSLKQAQKVLEKKMISKALTATGGNRTRAAQLLEISHPSLLSKIKEYGIAL
ncbi:MAG: sigma-54 dependent transcriptional regulator [Thermodesulfobacteriota bacterium]